MKQWFSKYITAGRKGKHTTPPGGAAKRPRLSQSIWAHPGHPLQSDGLFDPAQEHMQNVIVYRAVNLISHNLASVPWVLKQGKHTLETHPLARLMTSPNPRQSRAAFVEGLAAHILLHGNGYLEAVGNDAERHESSAIGCRLFPQELYMLRPDRMRVIPGRSVFPKAYAYKVEGHTRHIPVDEATGLSPILHIKNFHPQQDWYGLSPLAAAHLSIRQHHSISCHNLALMENGGRPSGALVIKPDAQGNAMDDAERDGLKSQLMHSYAGAQNAGRMMVLEGDMDWKTMSLTPHDMDFGAAKNMAAREIAQAYGVPPMLVGVPGDATFANYREARFHLWEDTILPLLSVILSEVNRWLFTPESDMRFTYDVDHIAAMALRRDPIWQRLKDADFLTEEEKRAAVGYGPKGD